ncbi:MAG: hypothetical protein AAGD00_10030 [Planctomycetota bacterium]
MVEKTIEDRCRRGRFAHGLGLALACLLAWMPAGVASAQAESVSPEELVEDWTHYVLTANVDVAEAFGRAILELELDPIEFVAVVEDSPRLETRFADAYQRATRYIELRDLAAEINNLYEEGRRARARDPREIGRNIEELVGPRRGQLLATRRLVEAGEYSVPYLLEVLLDGGDQVLAFEARGVLVDLGAQAVRPLSEAILGVRPETQISLARVLGQIGNDGALPYLYEVATGSGGNDVRDAARDAIEQIERSYDPSISAAERYERLAETYLAESRSVTSFPGESHQLAWSFDPRTGLEPTAVRSEVYHETMAMEAAKRALSLDGLRSEALSIWVAADFAREIETPSGYENPLVGDDRPNAMFHAVAFGPENAQRVLLRALDSFDTPLARRAIDALSRVAGRNAVGDLPGGGALVDALLYPDRRVQFDASLALAKANPTRYFPGAERVVPILANAVRDADARYAVVVSRDAERRQTMATLLEGVGYTVLTPVARLRDLEQEIAQLSGVDLIVSDLSGDASIELIENTRNDRRLAATPIFAVMPASAASANRVRFQADRLTRVARQGVSSEQAATAIAQLVERAGGAPVSADEAERSALDALDALLALARGGSESFDVGDATSSLVLALEETDGDVRVAVADVLSHIDQGRAQIALMDAAIDAFDQERVELLRRVARSARRHGNLLEPRHESWLLEEVTLAFGEEAEATAEVLGAIGLSSDSLRMIILGEE